MLLTRTNTALGVALLALLTGCSSSDVDPGLNSAASNESAITQYNSDSLKAQRAPSGLYYVIKTANPAGKQPAVGDEVGYIYRFSTLQNVLIDQRDTTLYAPFGTDQFITDAPLRLMRVGEYGVFLLPSNLAFGAQAVSYVQGAVSQTLPPYSPIRLDLRLVSSRTEDEQIDQYVASKKLTVTEKTATGLRFIKTLDNPAGAALTAGQSVTVRYSGILLRGTQPFDPGTTPLPLTLGRNQVVPGFEEGVRKMRVGEKAIVIFPSAQGYGAEGRRQGNQYVIPPYAPLVFTLEIIP